jgi:hypothetical protein
MDTTDNCHEAAARQYELAAQHHRLAAQRAADGDRLAAEHLAHAANVHAVRGHRYAIRASLLPDATIAEGAIDDD